MQASFLDLRRNMKNILAALDRHEKVTLTYRGKTKGVIVPCPEEAPSVSAAAHPAFGLWADRKDMADVPAFVRSLRKGRF